MTNSITTAIFMLSGIIIVINYFRLISRLGLSNINQIVDISISDKAITTGNVTLLRSLYATNSILGAVFFVGVANLFNIKSIAFYLLLMIVVVSYWIAGSTLNSHFHTQSGIFMGLGLVSFTALFSILIFRVDVITGLLSFLALAVFLVISYFYVRYDKGKMTARREHQFSITLSAWIVALLFSSMWKVIM